LQFTHKYIFITIFREIGGGRWSWRPLDYCPVCILLNPIPTCRLIVWQTFLPVYRW